MQPGPPVAIVGGGLAGLAAALALAERGVAVELYEAKRVLGGRAGSFKDAQTGETSDQCRHVSMGCCVNFADFCRRVGLTEQFSREQVLHFLTLQGQACRFSSWPLLPAPLHLAPGLWGLRFLTWRERLQLARAVLALAREPRAAAEEASLSAWLAQRGTPPAVVAGFWQPVLVSALGTALERVSLAAAQQVLVDGFLRRRGASDVLLPRAPLAELFDVRAAARLTALGVTVRRGASITRIARAGGGFLLDLASGGGVTAQAVIVAAPWQRAAELLADLAPLPQVAQLKPSAIAAVHLRFDRPITPLPHAVLVGMLSQWLFAEDRQPGESEFRYQVVVSAAETLAALPRDEALAQIVSELRQVFPAARTAALFLGGKIVLAREAVFAPAPGTARLRPAATTAVRGLFLAGDWTATGWPATMEGAVRSGYLAAAALLAEWGRPERVLAPEPRAEWLARLLIGGD